MGNRPASHVVVAGPVRGWWATWHGGEYIEIFASRAQAKADARGESATTVHVLNTTGDTIGDDRAAYVRAQLDAWVAEESDDFRANT